MFQNDLFLTILLYYFIVINLITCAVFAWDKRLARRRARRIPEKTLLLYAVIGGAIGGIAGMYVFRHKTLHKKFKWGLPIILLVQTALLVYVFWP